MKIISWNVNGLRAVQQRGFEDYVRHERPDVLCLQEIKAESGQVKLDLPGYEPLWNSAEKKGYSGTLVLTRHTPLSVSRGLGIEKHDNEGRVITVEYERFFLVNVYTPNSQRGLLRLDYRTKEWDPDFLAHLRRLDVGKPVVFCGDLNVAHKPIDLANPKSNERNAGYTIEERTSFDAIVGAGFVDTFRHFDASPGRYSWWSYQHEARAKNIGWRIDYVCVSGALVPALRSAFIQPQVQGSDHCPVGVELADL